MPSLQRLSLFPSSNPISIERQSLLMLSHWPQKQSPIFNKTTPLISIITPNKKKAEHRITVHSANNPIPNAFANFFSKFSGLHQPRISKKFNCLPNNEIISFFYNTSIIDGRIIQLK